jgi:hypothetical protein
MGTPAIYFTTDAGPILLVRLLAGLAANPRSHLSAI